MQLGARASARGRGSWGARRGIKFGLSAFSFVQIMPPEVDCSRLSSCWTIRRRLCRRKRPSERAVILCPPPRQQSNLGRMAPARPTRGASRGFLASRGVLNSPSHAHQARPTWQPHSHRHFCLVLGATARHSHVGCLALSLACQSAR